jgi:hypothetical protein
MIQQMRDKQKRMQAIIVGPTMIAWSCFCLSRSSCIVWLFVSSLFVRPTSLANVGLTKTEETNKRKIQELRDKQKQLNAIIFGPTMIAWSCFCFPRSSCIIGMFVSSVFVRLTSLA